MRRHWLALFFVFSGAMSVLPAAELHPSVLGDAKYTGPGSCSSPSCHGGIKPRTDTSVLQNEYSTWIVKDKHTQAYTALTNLVGQRMGRILGIPHPETASKCLACHALDVPLERRARSFDSNDGVSCENCHGPSSNWLGPHTTRGWNYQKSVEIGLYDTRDLVKRSEKCLSCHLGDTTKFVDHQMIAAGHPDLYFELDSFSAVQPRHWKEPTDKDPWIGVRTLATGQAVQLREGLRRLSRRAQGEVWPEYAELDCFACHHSLTNATDSWRQARGYPGRPPGNPPFNPSRYAVLQNVTTELDANAWSQLNGDLDQIYKLVSDITSDRRKIVPLAESAAEKSDRLARRIAATQFDRAGTLRLIKSICADADRISNQGERAAEQAAMSLDSLVLAYNYNLNSKAGNEDQLRTAVNALFRQLDIPSAYNAAQYARQMRGVSGLLP